MKRIFAIFQAVVISVLISALAFLPASFAATEYRQLGPYQQQGGFTGDLRLGNTCTTSGLGRYYCGLNASHITFFSDNTVSTEWLYPLAKKDTWRIFYTNGSGVLTPLALDNAGLVLKSNGPSAAPSWGSASVVAALDDLTDVDTTGASTGEVLQYNGSVWVPGTAGAGDMLLSVYDPSITGKITPAAGGTGADTSATTGFPKIVAGAWSFDNAATFLSSIGAQASNANLSTLSSPGNWKIFYSDGSGIVTALDNGTSGTFLKSNGGAAPSWDTPAGAGDVLGPASSTTGNLPAFSDNTGKVLADSGYGITAAGGAITGAASAAAQRTALGLGDMALQNASNLTSTDGSINATIGATTPKSGTFSSLAVGAVDNTEIGRLNGVTSNIQTQINAKQASDADLTTLSALGNWKIPYTNGSGVMAALDNGATDSYLKWTGTEYVFATIPGGGDVVGPASAPDNAIAVFDGTTGKLIKSGNCTVVDNSIVCPQGATGGKLTLREGSANGSNFRILQVPDALTQDLSFQFPDGNPSANQFFLLGTPASSVSAMSYGTFDTGDFQVSSGSVSIKALGVDIGQVNATGTPGPTNYLRGDGTWGTPAGTGDVTGPSSAVVGQLAYFDNTSGKRIAAVPGAGYNPSDNTTSFPGEIKTARSATVPDNIKFYELTGNGDDYVGFKAPDNVTETYQLVFPPAKGTVNQVLKLGADNVSLEWAADSTGGAPSFDTITSGSNTTATMTVGTGGSLAPAGSGTITASALSAQYVDWSQSSGATSVANRPTINSVAVTGTVLDNAANYPAALARLDSPSFTAPDIDAATGTSLALTGALTGLLPPLDNVMSPTAAQVKGYMHYITSTGTVQLPTAEAGLIGCWYSTTAAAISVKANTGDIIVLNGVPLDAGDKVTSASGAGDFICMHARNDTYWYTLGESGTWTDGGV